MRLWAYAAALAALLSMAGATWWVWHRNGVLTQELGVARAKLETRDAADPEVATYVQAAVGIAAASGDIAGGLVSLCDDTERVLRAAGPDAAAKAQSRDVRLARLAGEISECLREGEQLRAIQKIVAHQAK